MLQTSGAFPHREPLSDIILRGRVNHNMWMVSNITSGTSQTHTNSQCHAWASTENKAVTVLVNMHVHVRLLEIAKGAKSGPRKVPGSQLIWNFLVFSAVTGQIIATGMTKNKQKSVWLSGWGHSHIFSYNLSSRCRLSAVPLWWFFCLKSGRNPRCFCDFISCLPNFFWRRQLFKSDPWEINNSV